MAPKTPAYVPQDPGVAGLNTCFLPDQYAIIWAMNGSGDIMSYDPITNAWTDYGRTTLPDGTVLGSYSMDINNNTNNPLVVYQRNGGLYTAPLDDPTNVSFSGPANNPAFGSSFPCGAFRPGTEEYWVGIGSGSTVGVADLTTGEVTTLGTLTDSRDGAPLQAGPGDWFFDPEGNLFLMARDTRGATFGVTTGTVLWQINTDTLETTRIGNTDAPSSGTGAAWAAAGTYLLSTSSGQIYTYRVANDPAPGSTGAWTQEIPQAPHGVNDLGNQWIIPDPIPVIVCIDKDKEGGVDGCSIFTVTQDPVDPSVFDCQPFEISIPGKFGLKEPAGNPFVSDPLQPTPGDTKDPDKVWHDGCSDGGAVKWRDSCETGARTYLYGTTGEETPIPPAGFLPFECGVVQRLTETTQWCNEDVTPNQSVFRREDLTTGAIIWYDETGTINEPVLKSPGSCQDIDPLLPVSEQVVCLNDVVYIRVVKETYTEDADGLPQLTAYQILYYNENGTLYDSGVLNPPADPVGEPTGWVLGDCTTPYIRTEDVKLCEVDADFLLLIDSGGAFARYSFATGTWEAVNTLSVASAGATVDVENFLLYAFVAPDQLAVVDVNSDTQLPNVTVVDGAIKPGQAANPKTFSAASFRDANGLIYAWDTSGGEAGLYTVNPATGVVDFVTTISGVSGAGTSIMIDNTTDTLIINGSNLSYSVDWVSGVGTPWGDPPIRPNGGTFDASGNAYVTQDNNTYSLQAGRDPNDPGNWVQIIDDYGPGANSIAHYRVEAQEPSCFWRRFGILADGSKVRLGDYNVTDDSSRTVVGDVTCCECGCGSSGGTGETSAPEPTEYATTVSRELFTSAFTVPSPPANTKEIVGFNKSDAWIELDTNYGPWLIPPQGTAEMSVNDYEGGITVSSVSLVNGSFGPGAVWALNYRTAV